MDKDLRYDPELRGPGRFCVLEQLPDGAFLLRAVIGYGILSRVIETSVRAYGRDLPERREHAALFRRDETTWVVEARVWDDGIPLCSLVLSNVPEGLLDASPA